MKKSILRKVISEQVKNILKEEIDISNVTKILNSKLKELGFKEKVTKEDIDIENYKFKKITTIKINPKELGLIGPIFKSISVEISVGVTNYGDIYLVLHYSWTHPRGSNGYRAQLVYDGKKWEDRS